MRQNYLQGLGFALLCVGVMATGCGDDTGTLSAAASGGTASSNGGATTNFSGGVANNATGGASNNATGGASNNATGGASNNATGGASNNATGGASNNATGGTSTSEIGGASTSATGGASTSATGGASTSATGGASTSATGGASTGTSTKTWNFDTGVETWAVSWGDPTTIQTGTTVAWDGTVDSASATTSGSLKVNIPFTDKSQKLMVAVSWATAADLTGKTLTARIRLDTGLSCGTLPGGAKLFVKWVETAASGAAGAAATETWNYGDSGWVNLVASTTTWQTLTFDGSGTNPNGWTETGKTYNATLIRQIGIEIDTSGDAAAAGCTAATLHIDTVSY